MKFSYCFLLIVFIFPCNIQGQTGFYIKGELENAEGLKVYLSWQGDRLTSITEIPLLDSAVVYGKSFELTGQVEEPGYYTIFIQKKEGWKTFILENKTYQISGDANKIWDAKLEGSEEMRIWEEYATAVNPLIEKGNAVADSSQMMYAQGDTTLGRTYSEQKQLYDKQIAILSKDFILKYPDSYVSLFLSNNLDQVFNKEERRQVYEKLSNRIRQHSFAQKLHYELYELDDLIGIGKPAIPFSLRDQFDNMVHLSDYRGKYVLVEFWASWCGRCRVYYSPFLFELYHRYQFRGFEILGVSVNKNTEYWKWAVEEDGLPWPNVLDIKDGTHGVAFQYGIKTLPTNFLLDENGVLIAKNLHGEALAEKLRELFRN
ncbi:MAG TPA: TlpA disulfide reductase family protein [Saprospiraceae bacterium]|nr:TlpA disulfide reductase family protein [Saprospiraceae bacterium]HMP25479.1 TlpA disulfide reductase family protein [Saprospiraceae bacterium]